MSFLKYLSITLFLMVSVPTLIIANRLLSIVQETQSSTGTEYVLLGLVTLIASMLIGYSIGSLSARISNYFESKQ